MDEKARTLRDWLGDHYDLKPRFHVGQERYNRLWQTIEVFSSTGDTVFQNQWRGDFYGRIRTVEPPGRAVEEVTWKNVGARVWLADQQRYSPPEPVPWAEGFTYSFSLEDDYADLKWDYSSIPRTMAGVTFRQAFQVSAHYEFDFMRARSHAGIDRLTSVGQLLTALPEEGRSFSLSFAPVITNSILHRKNVQMGFLGLSLVKDAPCAIVEYRQGPQDFAWDTTDPEFSQIMGDPSARTWHSTLKSWQHGILMIQLSNGSLLEGEFTENHMLARIPDNGKPAIPGWSRGIWSLRDILPSQYGAGLSDWDQEQERSPWHCLFADFRSRA